jgi:hypothetical protein
MCQSCQLIRDIWSLGEDPWILHAVQKPTCEFLQQHMDHGLINDNEQYHLYMNNAPNEEEINNHNIERLISIEININLTIIISIFSLADNEEEEDDNDCIIIEDHKSHPQTSSSLGPQPSTSSTDTSTNGGLSVLCYDAKSVYAISCGHLLMCENCKCDNKMLYLSTFFYSSYKYL